MAEKLPRIQRACAAGLTTISLRWRGDNSETEINLAGWIATGGDALARLTDPKAFSQVRVVDYGAAIEWDEDADLAIDAAHLKLLAEEQQPFGCDNLRAWQDTVGLSNNEAADLLGVRLSTWNGYRAGGPIPAQIAMLCRAVLRDPVLMQAHYRPRVAGRPKKTA